MRSRDQLETSNGSAVSAADAGGNLSAIRSALDVLGHGMAVWSDDGTLAFRNEACASFFANAGIQLTDQLPLEDFLAALARSGLLLLPVDDAIWIEQERRLFELGGASDYNCIDGRIFRNERWSVPGKCVAMLIREITEDKRNQASLEKARDEASQADRTKSRFLRAANHDLRQPLASLKILIYNCMMADDEEHRSDLLHAMDISVAIMEDLLGALLNIGQLDAGQVKPRITTFQLSTLLERMDIEFGHQAREKGLGFRVVQSRYAVVSDRALLERIVSNLVANAIRYTERGSVLVGCRRIRDKVRLEIRDSGVGIAPENCDAIFEEFFQVEHSRKRQGALGLGLSIAKRVADILAHPLDVRSRANEGSIFSIDLPVGDILQSDIGEPEINEKIGGEFSGLSILVLEDDEILRTALTELLERWGITVEAFNAFENLALHLHEREFRPDLIITDYRLHGGLKGDEVVRDMLTKLDLEAPAIVVTADTDPKVIQGIRDDGFPVLIKPVSPPRLRVMMHNILYEPELVRELNPQTQDADAIQQ
jgi:signal transduction histidine kinase/CheY-like chemotaxis protein